VFRFLKKILVTKKEIRKALNAPKYIPVQRQHTGIFIPSIKKDFACSWWQIVEQLCNESRYNPGELPKKNW